jgi:hypothetical protein
MSRTTDERSDVSSTAPEAVEDDALMGLLLGPIGTTMAIGREKRVRTTTIADRGA